MQKNFLLIISFLWQISFSQQHLKLPALVSDNMVIQQSTQINIWGWADKNNKVEIRPSWNNIIAMGFIDDL